MFSNVFGVAVIFTGLIVGGLAEAAQDKKPRGGTVVGTVKGMMDTKEGKNTTIEVLAPGEEKARKYLVMWDAKIQAPMPHVLKAVRAAKVGDVVEFDWVDSNHGPMITSFKPFKKGSDKKEP